MGNPRVLLMDEPSEGLAPQIVAEVRRTIAQLKAEGQSIVLVEQNIKLTLDLADDVVIINTGRVAFTGSAGELKNETVDLPAPRRVLSRASPMDKSASPQQSRSRSGCAPSRTGWRSST